MSLTLPSTHFGSFLRTVTCTGTDNQRQKNQDKTHKEKIKTNTSRNVGLGTLPLRSLNQPCPQPEPTSTFERRVEGISSLVLDVTDLVRFRVCVQVFKCLHGMAPDYLSTMCHPVSRLPGRQNLRSANRGQLDVPRATLSSCGVRAFAHAGPSL